MKYFIAFVYSAKGYILKKRLKLNAQSFVNKSLYVGSEKLFESDNPDKGCPDNRDIRVQPALLLL